MNYRDIITIADSYAPNDLTEAQKIGLLFNFECEVLLEVMLLSQTDIDLIGEPNAETELSIKRPHAQIYWLRLICMLHEANREYSAFANATEHFNVAWAAFVQWYARTTAPGNGKAEYKGYYLSAYALAVRYGFVGTAEEWLTSLKGAKGDVYAITDADYAEIAKYCAEHYDEKIAEMDKALLKLENLTVDAVEGEEASVTKEVTETGIALHFTLPSGGATEDLTEELTEQDALLSEQELLAKEIAEMLASKKAGGSTETAIDLGIAGAAVGQIAQITEVDENGAPTAWMPVDLPSGGGGAEVERVVLADFTVEEDTEASIKIPLADDPFNYRKVFIYLKVQTINSNDQWWGYLCGGGKRLEVHHLNTKMSSTAFKTVCVSADMYKKMADCRAYIDGAYMWQGAALLAKAKPYGTYASTENVYYTNGGSAIAGSTIYIEGVR